jgi:parallel beta-helix repeat protein
MLSTYYVALTGSDGASGAAQAPWRTLQHAADVVAAGDTVIVRPGQYAGFDLWTDGTAANRITFHAEPGVTINARNARTPDGINLEGADYITIEGFTVTGVPRAGIRSVLNHHVTIRGNTADLNGRWGIFTGFSDDLLIENNVTSRSAQEHGIYVSNSGDRPVIRMNTIWGNNANGIHMNGDASQGGDGIISGALVEQNTIYENGRAGGSGINADGVQSSTFQNNLLYNNHASGVSLYRIDGAAGSKNNLLVNNTVVQASDARWALNIQNGSTGNTVYNNILYNSHSWRGSIDISQDSLSGFTSDYNVVMERFTTTGGNSILTLAQWRTATGQDLHSRVSTPASLFVNTAANDYHLSATSPALDVGTGLQAPSSDFEQDSRPSGSGFDIGADERQVTGGSGSFQFSSATFNVNEGGGSASITVLRTGGSTGAVTVNYATSNGSAAAGSDYSATSGTLSFAAGETSKSFSIPITNDSLVEGNESLNLTLSNPMGGAVLGTPSTASLTIVDNDTAAGVLQFSSATFSVGEGGRWAYITVQRTGGSTGTVTVNYQTSNGTATAGSDYVGQSGTLTFNPGQTSKTIRIRIREDRRSEGNESLSLILTNPTGGAVLGAVNKATLTIVDNDR